MSDSKRAERQVELVDIASLVPYAKNSRTHTPDQVSQIAASIKEFGWTNPVLIDEHGGVIAGHGRILAAKRLGEKTVPVITICGLSEAQKKAYVIADNKLALNAGWDDDMLKHELTALGDMGFDINLLGFDVFELEKITEGPDKLEEIDADLGGAKALKNDMTFNETDIFGIPKFRPDMLAEIPPDLRVWAGRDATPDDGFSNYLYMFNSDSLRGMPRDRFIPAFYVFDERFECLWTEPASYVARLLNLGAQIAISPNFSLWADAPAALQIYNTYRARWIGRYMQEAGIAIIPDVNWAGEASYEYSFAGIPKEAPAIAVQLQNAKNAADLNAGIRGLSAAIDALAPKSLLVYGGSNAERVVEAAKVQIPVTFVEMRSSVRGKYIKESKNAKS